MAELTYETPASDEVADPGLYAAQAAPAPLSQFRCARWGYGASCRDAPERCPMCGGGTWEFT